MRRRAVPAAGEPRRRGRARRNRVDFPRAAIPTHPHVHEHSLRACAVSWPEIQPAHVACGGASTFYHAAFTNRYVLHDSRAHEVSVASKSPCTLARRYAVGTHKYERVDAGV